MKNLLILISLIILSLNSAAQEWEQLNNLPGGTPILDQEIGGLGAQDHPQSFAINGYAYILANEDDEEGLVSVYRYNPELDIFELRPNASFPGQRRGLAYSTSYDGKGYLGFGIFGSYFNDLWRFDPVTETWTELATCECSGRDHPAFSIADGKIYVGMGSNDSGNLNDWWEYSIANNFWVQKPDFPSHKRHHPYHFSVDNKVYVGLGHGNVFTSDGNNIYTDFYRYDPKTEEWTEMASFPAEGRVAGTEFSYGNKGYVLSGSGEDHAQLDTGEFWEYDPQLDSWTELPPHPGSGRFAPASFVIDNYVYLFGGTVPGSVEPLILMNNNHFYRFDLEAITSTNITHKESANYLIYPNPVENTLYIKNTDVNPESTHFEIWSITGKQLQTDQYTNAPIFEMNISALSEGIYFLVLKDEETIVWRESFSKN